MQKAGLKWAYVEVHGSGRKLFVAMARAVHSEILTMYSFILKTQCQ